MALESNCKKASLSSSMLAPGFRFHPTDEELVWYYLRRKVCGKSFRYDAISEIDIYKVEPWDLPSMSQLKTRDLEWYFFSVLDKKYGNGSRTNRATEKGYWKTTGKDRAVYHKTHIVGMKKTLVYHNGRAPKGQRTNWVMHEYMLTYMELERAGFVQHEYVLCRVFQKSGSGPKNGERYGAPFLEEEWEDDELGFVPKEEAVEEAHLGDAFLDGQDLEQILKSDVPSDNTPPPISFHSSDSSCIEEITESVSTTQKLMMCAGEKYFELDQCEDKNLLELPSPHDVDVKVVRREYIGESSKSQNSNEVDYLLDEPFIDSSDNLKFGVGGFVETDDHSNPVDMLEEYPTFFDANNDDSHYLGYESSMMLGSEDLVSDQAFLSEKKELNEENEKTTLPSEHFIGDGNDAALLYDEQEPMKSQSDFRYPLLQQASQTLGNISAPPAFAAEFPSKDAALRLNSLAQSSSSVHVTAGMIEIRNLTMGSNETDWLMSKHKNFNIVLSFGFSRGDDGSSRLETGISILPGKTFSTLSRGWFCFIFFILILSMGLKLGTYPCAS